VAVTKADIVELLYRKVGFSKTESADVVESILEIMKERLEAGETVKLSGFGSFLVHEKKPRRVRNPQTGESITIRGRRLLNFKPSPVLKNSMNRGV